MSAQQQAVPRRPPQRGPGPMGSMGMPGEKSANFTQSGKRFLRELRPEISRIVLVMVLAVASVTLASPLGPLRLSMGPSRPSVGPY